MSRKYLGLGLMVAFAFQAGCATRSSDAPASVDGDDVVYETSGAAGSRTAQEERETIWDLFRPREDPGKIGAVNKYIWNASLEILDFLPVETIDPFTGVIVTGYGTPPGGGRAYRATIYVSDPALDARSLNVSLMTRNGPASASTTHAVEDAILTRARQLLVRDSKI